MAVSRGTKFSEIGEIPTDWRCVQVGQYASTSSGTTPSRRNFERYFKNGTISWVKTLDLNNGAISSTDEKVTEDALNETSLVVYPPGTVLVAMYGGFKQIGRTGILTIPACVNQALTAVNCNRLSLQPTYLLWVLNHRVEYWKCVASSSRKDPNITSKEIREFPIPLPPTLAEQEAIAGALSDADAWIESLEQLIVKKRQSKQGAMQELLTGKRRLPGFSGEWSAYYLADLCTKIQDGTHFSPRLGGSDYLYLTSKNVKFGFLDLSSSDRISAEEHSKIYARCDVRTGDLLLTKDGANTGNAALNTLKEPFSLLSSVALLRFDGKTNCASFFLNQLLSTSGQSQIKEMMSGNAITRLTLQKIRSLRFSVPKKAEQVAISETLEDMSNEVLELESKLAKARQIKQAMMQELLTGRIRLVEPRSSTGTMQEAAHA